MQKSSTITTIPYDPDSWPACWILDMIARTGDCSEFYHSSLWENLRDRIVYSDKKQKRCRPCWVCLHKSPPVFRDGTTAHHVIPVRQRPDLALSEYDDLGNRNVIPICSRCHWDMHHQRKEIEIPERW